MGRVGVGGGVDFGRGGETKKKKKKKCKMQSVDSEMKSCGSSQKILPL